MNGFTIYKEYYELITLLSEKEQQELLLAITKYMFEDIEPSLNDKQQKIFNNLKRPLDKSKNNSKNATKKKRNENEKETKEHTHQDVNVNVPVNVNVDVKNDIKEIIDYLNVKANSHYKYSTDKTQSLIKARFNDGFKLEDFKVVIDKKVSEWLGTELEKYLCPDTLFGPKFEKYLNQKSNIKLNTENKPNWMEKNIEKEKLTLAEQKELDELLRDFDK